VGILRQYHGGAEMEEEEILAEVGLVRAASEVLVCGTLRIKLKGRMADLNPFCYGVSLGAETIDEMEIYQCACRRVISVENKAVFRDLVRTGKDDSTLLLCLGGFAGPVKRRFLNKLHGFLGDSVKYYHWGDLDFGGMQIFCHLRRTCLPGLQPLLMDVSTYESFARLAEPFDEQYGEKLRSLLSKEEFTCFHELINVMLKYGCVLEQEAIPVSELGQKLD